MRKVIHESKICILHILLEPAGEFDPRKPLLKEVQEVVRKEGPLQHQDQAEHPKLLHRPWKILKVIWRRGRTVQQ